MAIRGPGEAPVSTPATPDSPRSARPFKELVARPVTWLWPGRLPLGKLSLLMGDPQLGKSLLTLDLCARLSTGRPWPDDTPSPGPAAALVVNAEDGDEDTALPRLQAAGADLGRCFVLERKAAEPALPLSLPGQTQVLEGALKETSARLVVIDPLLAFLAPGIVLASDQSVRRALSPLARLATAYDCAVLLVVHLNKRGVGRALYRALGSIGLVAACRSAWLVAADPDARGRAVLAQVKNNPAPPGPSLAYEIQGSGDAGPTVAWRGSAERTADDLLAAARGPGRPPSAQASACQFLADALRDGPRTVRELWNQARKLGFSERTMRPARRALDIEVLRRCEDKRTVTYWALPGQELPRTASPDDDQSHFDRWLKQQLELYPPPTPLDEP
jgi:putative DNA primase/helicase